MLIHGNAPDGFRTRTYISWMQMRQRCRNPNHLKYANYGGRGIKVCKRWDDFRNFFVDMGPRPEGMTLDRKNPNGNYCKRNCKWSDIYEQRHNQRRMKKCLTQPIESTINCSVPNAQDHGISTKNLRQPVRRQK